MSALKYAYTPRRRAGRRARPPSLQPLLMAPLLLLLVLGGYLATRGAEHKAQPAAAVLTSDCRPGKCPARGEALALSALRSPGAHPARTQADGATPPQITGLTAEVLEDGCAAPLYALNADMHRPPASLTKIVTALVAAERKPLTDLVTVSVDGAALSESTDSTVMGLQPGQKLSMRDLLYGLLLPSGNDAALQIAASVAGGVDPFVEMMNQRVAQLGLSDTHFTNPHGLDDPALYTSAHDIAVLGRELLRRPELAEIVRSPSYQPAWDGPALENLNHLLAFHPGAIGVKTGFTDQAGQTMVAAAEQDGRRIIVSVLGASTEIYQDVSSLLNWAFDSTSACTPTTPTATGAPPAAGG